jgi:hypothetical protein
MSTPPPPKTSLLRRISSDLGISLAALQVLLGAFALIVAIVGIVVTVEVARPESGGTPPGSVPPSPIRTEASSASPTVSLAPSSSPPSHSEGPTTAGPTSISQPTPTPVLNPKSGRFDCDTLRQSKPEVRNCGIVNLSRPMDLDNKYTDWGMESGENANLYYQDSHLTTYASGRQNHFISRIRNGAPSYSKCADPAARNYVYSIDVRNNDKNTMFCVMTPAGRYGAIRMIKDWASSDEILVTVVIWEPKS